MTNGIRNAEDLTKAVLLMGLLCLFSYWVFIDTYRLNAFNIVPHDDYAPYLLYLTGEEGGRLLGAPFVYRFFSVVAAIPFFFVLPVYEFSLLENPNHTYLRAIEALAMVSYLSMLLSAMVIYRITTTRFGANGITGIAASLAAMLLFQFSGYKGVDPVGILIVCLLVYYSRNVLIFAPLVMLSVGFNEKIALVLAFVMIARVLLGRQTEFISQALFAALACLTYVGVRLYLGFPGNEDQLQPGGFLSAAAANIASLATLKNMVLIVAPSITLVLLYFLATMAYKSRAQAANHYFSVFDISALAGLFIVSMAVGVQSFARMAMFCFPLYLPLATIYVSALVNSSVPPVDAGNDRNPTSVA